MRSILSVVGSILEVVEDFLTNNLSLQEYWLKRFSAVVVDYFIILMVTGIIWPNSHILEFVLASGTLSLAYFSIMEAFFGFTLGKKIFSLKIITSRKDIPTLKKSLIRNITKFNIAILLVDAIIGFRSKRRQKYTDEIVRTKVVEVIVSKPKSVSEIIYCEEPTTIS